jgi:hypothetical protein
MLAGTGEESKPRRSQFQGYTPSVASAFISELVSPFYLKHYFDVLYCCLAGKILQIFRPLSCCVPAKIPMLANDVILLVLITTRTTQVCVNRLAGVPLRTNSACLALLSSSHVHVESSNCCIGHCFPQSYLFSPTFPFPAGAAEAHPSQL